MPYRRVIMSVRAGIAKSMGDSTRGRQNAKRERSEFIGVAKSIGITRRAESVCKIVTGGGNTECQLYGSAAARCGRCPQERHRKARTGFPMPFFFRRGESPRRQKTERSEVSLCSLFCRRQSFLVVPSPCRTAPPAKARAAFNSYAAVGGARTLFDIRFRRQGRGCGVRSPFFVF